MKKAFTMAEVLITLGVIGIVAALTIPQMIKHYKKVEAETRLKKAYSVMSQTYLAAQVKYGDGNDWLDWNDAQIIVEDYFAPLINDVKVFPPDPDVMKAMCFEDKYPGNHTFGDENEMNAQYTWMNGVYISNPLYENQTASMRLNDGTCVGINGTADNLNNTDKHKKNIIVDINGSSIGPNVAGYDLFFFVFKDNNIVPYGYDWSTEDLKSESLSQSCNKKAPLSGYVCAARIMAEGWTIKYW